MRLPDSARADLLEFLGATPVADAQLADMIETVNARIGNDLRGIRMEAH
jgi:hypothetical protein